MSTLRVDLAGEIHEIERENELTFGRDADLVVDSNRFLHRRLGVFRFSEGSWWLANIGSAIGLTVVDTGSTSSLELAPGTAAPLPFHECLIRFQAGQSSYELIVEVPQSADFTPYEDDGDGSTTITATAVNLNAEQRLLLVGLAEKRLLGAGRNEELPTNRQVADRLGWTITKYNRKLDNLCSKFDRLGVPGIKGDLGGMATSRRERLVDHAMTSGIVNAQDLPLLDGDTS